MSMSDFLSGDNNKADAIKRLQVFCDAHNLSYEYGEFDFTVKLPGAEPISPTDHIVTKPKRSAEHMGLDSIATNWDKKGFDETDPDNPENFKISEGEV